MLRRLKNDDSGGSASGAAAPAESGGDESPDGGAAGQMSSLQKYRSQTMKDYGLMIEYKHLRQHVPAGIYVLPSFDQGRVWYGVIFVHTGLYRNGIFKFTIYLPEDYNGPGTYPRIVFNTSVFHPYVFPETKELDLKPKFPEWDPELHYMVAVLTYLKSIFYLKDFPQTEAIANPDALEMFRHNPEEYVENVESSVETSLENVYNNEQGSTIRFTKHSPAHDHLRQELFAQLESKPEVKDRPSETLEEKLAVPPPSASMSLVTATVAAAAATSEGTTVSEEPMPDAGMSP